MASRSVHMTILNTTDFALRKIKSNLCHGEFTEPFGFPETIPPGGSGVWQAESDGVIPILGSIATGTEGWVKYRVVSSIPNIPDPGDMVLFYWDNPFVGNTFFGFKIATQNIKPSKLWHMAGGCDDDSRDPNDGSGFPEQPSRFKFFALHFALKDGTGPGLVGLIQGERGERFDGIILPLPGQDHIKPLAWFKIGILDTLPPRASLRLPLQAMKVEPSIGIRQSLGVTIPFSLRELLSA